MLHGAEDMLKCLRRSSSKRPERKGYTDMNAIENGSIADETCDALCRAAREKSLELGIDISFAVVDADGLPRMFRRFGDALVLSATLVPAK